MITFSKIALPIIDKMITFSKIKMMSTFSVVKCGVATPFSIVGLAVASTYLISHVHRAPGRVPGSATRKNCCQQPEARRKNNDLPANAPYLPQV